MKNISTLIISAFSFLMMSISTGYGQIPATAKEQIFKDWDYSSSEVFGIIKMDHPDQKAYYKIFKPNNESVKIQEYNAAGILTNTNLVRFVNGKLNQMTSTDRWGDTYEITKFTVSGPDEFMVIKKNTGENSFLPCKGAKYIYKDNLLSETRYLSYASKTTTNSSGVAITKYKRYTDQNRFSLVKEMAFFDADNHPVISSSYDCHKVIYEYDERGNQTSIAYYGTDNEPLANRFGGFKNRSGYNENDQMITYEIIGINDEVTKNAYGVAKVLYEYKKGYMSKATRFDEHNHITKGSEANDGVAIYTYEYDADGNKITDLYFDEQNNPVNNNSGYQKVSYTYDPLDMYTGTSYFDRYGSPVNDKTGIHKYSYVRDDQGRLIQKAYYDNTNSPVKDNLDKAFMVKYKYDDWGRMTSKSFWENASTKMNRWDGRHETIYKYNDEGQETEDIFLDQSGNQFLTKAGFSRVIYSYNAEARVSEYKYFNKDIPASIDSAFANKFHAIKRYYDANGRISSIRYFDQKEQPVDAYIELGDGINCHKIEFIYKANTIVEERIYTSSGDAPSKIIDCLKNDYISLNGISKGYKNL